MDGFSLYEIHRVYMNQPIQEESVVGRECSIPKFSKIYIQQDKSKH
jgi:hypothetical protein